MDFGMYGTTESSFSLLKFAQGLTFDFKPASGTTGYAFFGGGGGALLILGGFVWVLVSFLF